MPPLTYTTGDLQAAAGVLQASAAQLEAQGQALWPLASLTPERLARHYPAGGWQVAWRAGQAVGTYCLLDRDPPFWPDDPPGEALYLHKLAVHPAAQGSGLSTLLLADARARTQAAGRPWLKLDTAANRPALRALYERAGFVPCGEREVFGFRVVLFRQPTGAGA
ncbi:GNAT family N-acetyltransferase [Deinococcus multiflagellatus]|uniref:GNAT family N-acetyltransferase n=1 Tax=Deinococcus multiflagellatus TaxID=1656887 RepID=UPI001CD03DB7|nr:GNAT family N-acetyltransferase [Deinococcus multiflagellatus]MBZ9712769.1 GNAT family N-acetyltransferase [Deinococcus multiflagellatus]